MRRGKASVFEVMPCPSKCRPSARKYFENVDKNIAVLRFDRDRCFEYKRSAIRSPCKCLSKTGGGGGYLESMKEILESLEWKLRLCSTFFLY